MTCPRIGTTQAASSGASAVRHPVDGEHDRVGLERVDRLAVDRVAFDDLDSRSGGMGRESPDPAGRIERAVARDGRTRPRRARERLRERVEPLGREPVLTEGLVLAPELVALGRVDREPERADAPERIAGQRLHRIETALGELPGGTRRLGTERLPGDVVAEREPAESEAAVAAAGAAGDLAGLEQPHALPALGERESARAAGDSAADDHDVDRADTEPRGHFGQRLGEPI